MALLNIKKKKEGLLGLSYNKNNNIYTSWLSRSFCGCISKATFFQGFKYFFLLFTIYFCFKMKHLQGVSSSNSNPILSSPLQDLNTHPALSSVLLAASSCLLWKESVSFDQKISSKMCYVFIIKLISSKFIVL